MITNSAIAIIWSHSLCWVRIWSNLRFRKGRSYQYGWSGFNWTTSGTPKLFLAHNTISCADETTQSYACIVVIPKKSTLMVVPNKSMLASPLWSYQKKSSTVWTCVNCQPLYMSVHLKCANGMVASGLSCRKPLVSAGWVFLSSLAWIGL